jgi:hypothetical protein
VNINSKKFLDKSDLGRFISLRNKLHTIENCTQNIIRNLELNISSLAEIEKERLIMEHIFYMRRSIN